ncbi:hypothetical protein [Leisingera sp.]
MLIVKPGTEASTSGRSTLIAVFFVTVRDLSTAACRRGTVDDT